MIVARHYSLLGEIPRLPPPLLPGPRVFRAPGPTRKSTSPTVLSFVNVQSKTNDSQRKRIRDCLRLADFDRIHDLYGDWAREYRRENRVIVWQESYEQC